MTTIDDSETLISDFQTLLTDPHTTPTIKVPPKTLALPRQILSVRNDYFKALLSPRWYSSQQTLEKLNTTPQQFQDLLEFLLTGCITLSSAPSAIHHNIALTSLAHEVLAHELEAVLAAHIRNSLTRHTLTDYLAALTTPVPPVDAVLTAFLSANTSLLPTIPHNPATAKQVCRLLAAGNIPYKAYSDIARYIRSSLLPLEDLAEDPKLRNFLLRFPSPLFVPNFEPSNLFSPAELLQKYRSEALTLPTPPPPTAPSVRLLFESSHPHARPANDTVQHVVVPGRSGYARLVFDKRSSLSDGAELAFYLEDPLFSIEPCKFLVGRRFETCFILPAHQFWFAFSCTVTSSEDGRGYPRRWGWKFFVESCPSEIDYWG